MSEGKTSALWLVTGVAGFIGGHLAESLLAQGHKVVGLDNFSSGKKQTVSHLSQNASFEFHEGDIRDPVLCLKSMQGVDYVLHHAAIGSVPKSIEDPRFVNDVNHSGFLNILDCARISGIRKVVYASSSAVYGNTHNSKPRSEDEILKPLSPYAASKCANEFYAQAFSNSYGLESVGLRYFNIYGPRQDPAGAYAAVIPKWISAMQRDQSIEIYGDGTTMRDFCAIGDVVKANIHACTIQIPQKSQIYNIGSGSAVSLNNLFEILQSITGYRRDPIYKDFRQGDIHYSCADIQRATKEIGFSPSADLKAGLIRMIGQEDRRHAI